LLGFEEWRAMDTFALHRRQFVLVGGWREVTPIGWGGARNGRQSFRRGEHGGSWRTNPRTSARAAASTVSAFGYRGIPGLRDMSPRQSSAADPELRIAVEVARRATDVSLVERAAVAVEPRSDTLRAIGEARVMFDAPEGRRDGRAERANLYNPYWRARLAPVARSSRAIAAASNGVVDPFLGVAP
jgi:hypothetical protein